MKLAENNLSQITFNKSAPNEVPKLNIHYRGYIIDHHSPDPPIIRYDNFNWTTNFAFENSRKA